MSGLGVPDLATSCLGIPLGLVILTAPFGATRTEPVRTWAELGERMAQTRPRCMPKGILTAESAVAAIGAGDSAGLVPNHGGRQLDATPSALDQVPEIAAAIGDRPMLEVGSVRDARP